ncbi:hypothetical protein RB195_020461 [Necator americanus]|uniref:Reverse transcriptase domain-containing protein n=1 Tax=Necator americanus TaxID=51031 RepID=A0ABR1CJA5_NECAM
MAATPLRFADDIDLITSSISQAERMLTEFRRNMLNGTNISECISYVYLGREMSIMNVLTLELGGRRRTAWEGYKSIEKLVKKTKNSRLRAYFFNATVLPALAYPSETWAFRKQEENVVNVIERAVERVLLGVSLFVQVREGIRSFLLRQRSKTPPRLPRKVK